MCKASRATNKTADAKANTTLGVSTIKDHGEVPGTHGAFHTPGETVAQCVQCVQTGTRLTVSNIPVAIQKAYNLRAAEVVTFIETPEWHKDDQLVFDRNKVTVDLKAFANQGVEVYVGIKQDSPDIARAVDDLKQAALTTTTHADEGEGLCAPSAREREHA